MTARSTSVLALQSRRPSGKAATIIYGGSWPEALLGSAMVAADHPGAWRQQSGPRPPSRMEAQACAHTWCMFARVRHRRERK